MKEIKLSRGLVAIVDDEDFEELNKYKWSAYKSHKTYYAYRGIRVGVNKWTMEYMHRVINKTADNMQCDHIDGNGLNNCKSNLREVTIRQNSQNRHENKSSQYTGVSWIKSRNKWSASMGINGKSKHIGYYDSELEAHNAYVETLHKLGEMHLEELGSK